MHTASTYTQPILTTDLPYSKKTRFYLFLICSVESKAFFLFMSLLLVPTLWTGLMADDYYLAARALKLNILPSANGASLWNMFTVSDAEQATLQHLIQNGLMPWWTSPDFRFQMWRPLAEFSHWLDFRFWPNVPLLMHAHQLVWVFSFLALSYRFLIRFSNTPNIGMIAFIFFALSANHGQTFAWLASRNTLMAATFGMAAVLLHVTSREKQKPAYRLLAIVTFFAALMSSEYGLCASAWLFAWTVTLDKGNLAHRLLRLMPYGIVMLVWAWLYQHWNYGVTASEYYIDPIQAPMDYLAALIERVPAIVFNSLLHFPNGLLGSTETGGLAWFAACIISVMFLFLLKPLFHQTNTRFLLIGCSLCMLPIAAGPSGARTLAFVSLGVAPLLATIFQQWTSNQTYSLLHKRLSHFLIWPVTVLTIASIGMLPSISVIYNNHNQTNVEQPATSLPFREDISQTNVVLLNPNSVFYSIFYPLSRAYQGLNLPNSFYPLASGNGNILFERDSSTSFILTPENGFLSEPAAYFMRRKDEAFFVGQEFVFPAITMQIESLLDDGRPASLRVSFRNALESKKIKLVFCENNTFHEFTSPQIGESITLAACKAG